MDGEKSHPMREIALGIFLTLALAALAAALVHYAHFGRLWKKRQDILVVFESVGSLTLDAPVRYNGLEIGRVKSLRPVHLDEKIIEDRFRVLTRRDLNNLPIREDAIKHKLLEEPEKKFDALCRQQLVGCSMVELNLEVLADNDPIRYRVDDDVRIVSSIFGDSMVEIISGSGPINDSEKGQYVIGTSGDFFSNLAKSMGEVNEILDSVGGVIGEPERKSFAAAQARYAPANAKISELSRSASARMEHTLKRYNELTQTAKTKLNETGKVLESLQPAAQKASDSIQKGLKEIQDKSQAARDAASLAMKEITQEVDDTREGVSVPLQQIREGLDAVRPALAASQSKVEKIPARLDAGSDAAGSMITQSQPDLAYIPDAAKKALFNLKVTAFVAKENKDLMLSNRDVGEYATQSAIDALRSLERATRYIRRAAGDALDAAREMDAEMLAGPVIDQASKTAKHMDEIREPIEAVRDELDNMVRPSQSKRGH